MMFVCRLYCVPNRIAALRNRKKQLLNSRAAVKENEMIAVPAFRRVRPCNANPKARIVTSGGDLSFSGAILD